MLNNYFKSFKTAQTKRFRAAFELDFEYKVSK